MEEVASAQVEINWKAKGGRWRKSGGHGVVEKKIGRSRRDGRTQYSTQKRMKN